MLTKDVFNRGSNHLATKEFTPLLNGVAYKDGIIVEENNKAEKVAAG